MTFGDLWVSLPQLIVETQVSFFDNYNALLGVFPACAVPESYANKPLCWAYIGELNDHCNFVRLSVFLEDGSDLR